ncbi:MAG: hypothetical protein R8J84_05975 [Mariprofundales bacterium]
MSGANHRKNFRPPSPIPRLTVRLDIMMESLAKSQKWKWVAHGALLAFALLCSAVVWWSVDKRLIHLNQTAGELQGVMQLNNQLDQLKQIELDDRLQQLQKNLTQQNRLLFVDQKAVVHWLMHQIRVAEQQRISLTYSLGVFRPALVGHRSVSIDLRLRPAQGGRRRHSYVGLIEFSQAMVRDMAQIRIEQASMQGNGTQAIDLHLTLTAWVK